MEGVLQKELILTLKNRFEENKTRHPGIEWKSVQDKLESETDKLQVLYEMERSGGEPDVVGYIQSSHKFIFCDFSPESPSGRRSLCYDPIALDSRKKNKPSGSAVETAHMMGIELLTEEQYRELQELGEFDRKTSSWIKTPQGIRDLGGALFCDRRFNHVFIYHNGAESYYASRGFRGRLKV